MIPFIQNYQAISIQMKYNAKILEYDEFRSLPRNRQPLQS